MHFRLYNNFQKVQFEKRYKFSVVVAKSCCKKELLQLVLNSFSFVEFSVLRFSFVDFLTFLNL